MDYLSEVLETNVVGTNNVIKTFLHLLRQGHSKKIVLFFSTLGCITTAQTDVHMVTVGFPVYKSSKAGTHMITVLWSNDLKKEGLLGTCRTRQLEDRPGWRRQRRLCRQRLAPRR
jgi:NAD(P)-dependent dehydrogenase (short-subunit alcohol dehydrogenase family)